MNSEVTIRQNIENALNNFLDNQQPLREASTTFLNTLGYHSKLVGNDGIDNDRFDRLTAAALETANPTDKLCIDDWYAFYQILQVRDNEINEQITEQPSLFESRAIDEALITSYMFVAMRLAGDSYTRTQLADITRFININITQDKRARRPIMVIFRYGSALTLAIINRRTHNLDPSKRVLEKVTLIKDINLDSPKRAHIDILSELYLQRLIEIEGVTNFDTLHKAWEGILNTEALNKDFYRKLFAWYEWAVGEKEVKFPTDEKRVLKKEEHVIRLITRILFIWFIKEKGLVEEDLFKKDEIQSLLKEKDFDNGNSYYRAVLQNLFFATLNTEIDKRKFSKETYDTNRDFSCYRYKKQMDDPDKLLSLFAQTPFINGGLFDCLDTFKATGEESYRIDCFSDNQYKKLSIPNRLFFDARQGLIPLLEHYKFTVEENTPIDQEVALDPELLGRVFENLLAAINPETGATARKQTGSYYTPRAIVDYMVEEALVAALFQKCQPTDGNAELWDERLRYLFDYAKMFDDAHEWFDDCETDAIVKTISELKILDPAVGSGAFPMGMLHKLTLALRRLDPDNTRWEALQMRLARGRAANAFNTQNPQERKDELSEISDTFERYRDSDFGRKLYLIQNSIFGVDIQPIACQIAKLRFFISLAIEQEPDTDPENNYGIKPLPNLETRFIAANTLIGLSEQGSFTSDAVRDLERQLRDNREQYFHAITRQQKRVCKDRDKTLRRQLAAELTRVGMPFDDAEKIAKWDIYDQNAIADWFDLEWMFGLMDGFDVVIGNPPYIKEYTFKEAFDGLRGSSYYQGKMDLWYFFACKGLDLLKEYTGVLSFIVTSNWGTNHGASVFRNKMVAESTILKWLDFGNFRIFESSDVQTMILVCLKNNLNQVHSFDFRRLKNTDVSFENVLELLNKHESCNSSYLTPYFDRTVLKDKYFVFSESSVEKVLEKLSGQFNFALRKNEIAQGIVPNPDVVSKNALNKIPDYKVKRYNLSVGDGVFVVPKRFFPYLSVEESTYIKPLYEPVDLSRYYLPQESCKDIIYLTKKNWKPNLNTLVDHLSKYREIMEARRENQAGKLDFCHLHWPRKEIFFRTGERILSVRKCETPTFVYTDREAYVMMAINIIRSDRINLKYLTGVLNSKVVRFWLKHKGKMQGYQFQVDKEPLLALPLILPSPEQQAQIVKLVNQILDIKHTGTDADTTEWEEDIDQLVYDLYDLTDDEIAIVEKADMAV